MYKIDSMKLSWKEFENLVTEISNGRKWQVRKDHYQTTWYTPYEDVNTPHQLSMYLYEGFEIQLV